MRGDGLILHQGRARLGVREHSCSSDDALAQLPREGGSPSLGVSQSCGDVALRDVGSGHGGVGWGWGSWRAFPALMVLNNSRRREGCSAEVPVSQGL